VGFDGSSIWAVSEGAIYKINRKLNTVSTTIPISTTSPNGGFAFDGSSVWIAGRPIIKINPTTNEIEATVSIDWNHNLAFDGKNLWATTGSNILSKIPT
jgi:DNA-binding beta-propeller fold protein YncE